MKDYYQQSIKALQLAGMSERTQQCYTRSVRMLADYYHKTPDQLSEDELQEYFLYRINQSKWAPNTMKICYSGIKFFFTHVLKREWHIFNILRAKREKRLPCVLSRPEVDRILKHVRTFHNRVFLTTVYSCGLRLQEALHLQVSDIDSCRMMIHVHRGKQAKDRYVPLPEETLCLLRRYWCLHRNQRLIFPALGRNGKQAPTSKTPMAIDSVQGALRNARLTAGIRKRRVTIHTLRHSYATHLLEAGVNLKVIQRYLGHALIETTMIYCHLTQKGHENASLIVNNIMKGF